MVASSFLTGERAVVALFIAWIVFSTPQSLLSESLSLSLLSLLALSVEISIDASSSVSLSHFFKIRPGASSGIFLGAVTLPGLMVSKLIQMSRAVSLNQSGSEENTTDSGPQNCHNNKATYIDEKSALHLRIHPLSITSKRFVQPNTIP